MKRLALLLLLAACFGTRTLEDVAPTGDLGEIVIDQRGANETVRGSDQCDNITYCWRFAPWRRLDDLAGGPGRWLVSVSNRACLVNDAQFALALIWEGRMARCYWRSPQ